MPKIEVNDEQILSCLDQLSPSARRAALAKLIGGMERLYRLVERNRAKIETICRERGVEFSRLTEQEREALVDQILHESRQVKVVLDTNIIVSGLLWRGAPYRCLLAIQAGLADLIVSPPILEELSRVLVTKFHHTTSEAEEVLAFVRESATLVEIPGALRVIHDDPDDDKFIETAVVAGATYIVTGDRHLLALRSYQGISVIGSRAFLDRLSSAPE